MGKAAWDGVGGTASAGRDVIVWAAPRVAYMHGCSEHQSHYGLDSFPRIYFGRTCILMWATFLLLGALLSAGLARRNTQYLSQRIRAGPNSHHVAHFCSLELLSL